MRRREQWDQVIADVRQELGQTTSLEQKLIESESLTEDDKEHVDGVDFAGKEEKECTSLYVPITNGHDALQDGRREIDELPMDHSKFIPIAPPEAMEQDGRREIDELPMDHSKFIPIAPPEAMEQDGRRETDELPMDYSKFIPIAPPEAMEQDGRRETDELPMDHSKFIPIAPSEALEQELELNLDSSARRPRKPELRVSTGPGINLYHVPPQSLYATDYNKMVADQALWTQKKLHRSALSMDMLQLSFFKELHKTNWATAAAAAVPESYAELILLPAIRREAAFLQKKQDFDRLLHTPRTKAIDFSRSDGDLPICHFRQDSEGAFRVEQTRLRDMLEELFKSPSGWATKKPEWLAKIFYSLSTSSAPPNVDIYNTLIVGLRKHEHYRLVHAVITSFVQTRMRPNEVSLASILSFYADVGNETYFRRWMDLIRGQCGGLMVVSPFLNPLRFDASKGRVVRRPDKPEVRIQLPYPTPMVFGALIKGVLKFNGLDGALDVCKAMHGEGWGLDMTGFDILLKDCADRADWDAGHAIWRQIVILKHKSKRLIDGRWKSETISVRAFADMLRLCIKCKQKAAFEDLIGHARKTHPDAMGHLANLIRVDMEKIQQAPKTDER
jgi:hypothetical protein